VSATRPDPSGRITSIDAFVPVDRTNAIRGPAPAVEAAAVVVVVVVMVVLVDSVVVADALATVVDTLAEVDGDAVGVAPGATSARHTRNRSTTSTTKAAMTVQGDRMASLAYASCPSGSHRTSGGARLVR
jgi:hypothetical protein